MTSEQLAAIKVGDLVAFDDITGQVTQAAPSWFMVTWDGFETPEIIKRDSWGYKANRLRRIVEAIDD